MALAEPGKRPLHNPAARLSTARATRTRLFTDCADVGHVAQGCSRFTTGGVIESFVEQQMLFLVVGSFDNDRKQRVFQATSVMPIGRCRRDT